MSEYDLLILQEPFVGVYFECVLGVFVFCKMAVYPEVFLREFFELYKEQECLWKIKSELYHNRNARKKAMDSLVLKFQEVNKQANEEFVKKKINNYRTSYKRELKLVQQSNKSGIGTDDIYKPKLWYFDLLSFLNDQDVPREAIDNISDEEGVSKEQKIHFNNFILPWHNPFIIKIC